MKKRVVTRPRDEEPIYLAFWIDGIRWSRPGGPTRGKIAFSRRARPGKEPWYIAAWRAWMKEQRKMKVRTTKGRAPLILSLIDQGAIKKSRH